MESTETPTNKNGGKNIGSQSSNYNSLEKRNKYNCKETINKQLKSIEWKVWTRAHEQYVVVINKGKCRIENRGLNHCYFTLRRRLIATLQTFQY